MTDPFKKLIIQAIQECEPDDRPSKDRTLQRFGELIVRECMREAGLPLSADGKYDHLLPSQMIAKHFAME